MSGAIAMASSVQGPTVGPGKRTAGRDSGGWLFGPSSDLILGCGLGSMAVMAVQSVAGDGLARFVPGGLLVLLFSLPHYGATLVRVYEEKVERLRYAFFAVWSTAALAALFASGLHWLPLGSIVLTLYITWSPWHYTGQNYGIALMLFGRRSVRVAAPVKRWIHASFVLSYGLTFTAIHAAAPEGTYAPVSYGDTVFELLPIGIPRALSTALVVLLGAGYLGSLVGAVVGLRRAAGWRRIAPGLLLLATQSLWFAIPVFVRHFALAGPSSVFASVYTAYGFLWIAGYHAVQYLWITTYYGSKTSAALRTPASPLRRRARFLTKAALAGYAVWTVPALLFAPGLFGQLPYDSGLALMVAAVVNLHHFILDGAVWKLRDGRVARVLLRTRAPAEPSPVGPGGAGAPWLRRCLQGLGAVCIVYGAVAFWAGDRGFSTSISRGDLRSARVALDRMAALGRDSPNRRIQLGRRLAGAGDPAGALRQIQQGLDLHPSFAGYQSLAQLHAQERRWRLAATAYDSALARQPDNAVMLYRAGLSWLEAGDAERAVALLTRAADLAPDQKLFGLSLARARRLAAAGGPDGQAGD